jgi:phosphate-selective porin OprO/OprP
MNDHRDPVQRARHLPAVLLAAAILPVTGIAADAPDTAELLRRLEEQEQKTRVLERKLEIQDETAQAALKSNPVVKAGPKGFSIQSADGANVIKLKGLLQGDARHFFDDQVPPEADTFVLRRVRPILEGTVGGKYDFRFMPDFAGGRTTIVDAWLAARFKPWLVLTAGKQKQPVGLERLQSGSDMRFIERALPTSLVPNRDLGLQLSGDLLPGVLNYAVGYFNGAADGASSDGVGDVETDGDGEWAARLFAHPFANSGNFYLRGLGLGISATVADTDGRSGTGTAQTLLAGYRSPGQNSIFSYRGGATNATFADGDRVRISPQAYWYVGSFGLLGEYVRSSQDVTRDTGVVTRSGTIDNDAWQVQVSWFLTGEEESFKGFSPNSTFNIGGPGWGAFELVARYHTLDVDDAAFVGGADSFADPTAAVSKASAVGIGLNWYFNQNLKWSVNYEQTRFDGGAAGGADRDDEKALLGRFSVSF